MLKKRQRLWKRKVAKGGRGIAGLAQVLFRLCPCGRPCNCVMAAKLDSVAEAE
jgi:hypothetical protein